MGNQIYGMMSSQFVSCEECLQEIQGLLKFEKELSGSRLFKVAKARSTDNENGTRKIVKIFPYEKGNFPISDIQNLIIPFCKRIENAYNVLALTNVTVTDRYIFLIRDFVDHSLSERLCTRPFLSLAEKRWIAFQLLSALDQLHSSSKEMSHPNCHGDIKSENVLLTSWGWLLLADAAPFKPTLLPSDNPSEFTYCFDSSRRRACYLAPERFVDRLTYNNAVDFDHEFSAFNSAPDFLNLQCSQTSLRKDEFILGEVADESMEYNETMQSPLSSAALKISISCDAMVDPGKSIPIAIGQFCSTSTDFQLSPVDKCFDSESCPNSLIAIPSMTRLGPPLASAESSKLPINISQLPCLNVSMDLFSAGCVLLEMFTDGTVAFTLSDLLSYRQNETSRVLKLLASIPYPSARLLISNLISLDQIDRGTAANHLNNLRGTLFPTFFYTDLHKYMQVFLDVEMSSPETRLFYLRGTLPKLLLRLSNEPKHAQLTVSIIICNIVTASLHPLPFINAECVATSAACLPVDYQPQIIPKSQKQYDRRVLSEEAKVDAIFCFLMLAEKVPSVYLFDRIIPYLVDLVNAKHNGAEVRRLALDSTVQVLEKASAISFSIDFDQEEISSTLSGNAEYAPVLQDLGFLNEYLLPSLALLANDTDLEVRIAMSRCLPRLSDVCLRLADLARSPTSKYVDEKPDQSFPALAEIHAALRVISEGLPNSRFKAVLSNARSQIHDRLVTLLSDPSNFVRRSLMETQTLAKLATFLGRADTNDTILSHMVTFLNDKEDPFLRTAFFRQLGPLAGLFGAQSVTIMRPLLEQGLSDPDEIVLDACLRALCHLLRRRLLSGPVAIFFLYKVMALTSYPSNLIRQDCVAYITLFSRNILSGYSAKMVSKEEIPLLNDDDESIKKVAIDGKYSTEFSQFMTGVCGVASLYAHLGNPKSTENIFVRPLGHCFTDDAVIIDSLQPPLCHGLIDTIVSSCLSVSLSYELSATAVFHSLISYLMERKCCRNVTRSDETPCYAMAEFEYTAELLFRLQSLGLSELMEDQILQLAPLLANLCSIEKSALKLKEAVPFYLRGSCLHVRQLNSTSETKFPTEFPIARFAQLPTSSSTTGVSFRFLDPSSSSSSNPFSLTMTTLMNESDNTPSCIQNISQILRPVSYIEAMLQRLKECRIVSPTLAKTNMIFSRSLSFDEESVSQGGTTSLLKNPPLDFFNRSSSFLSCHYAELKASQSPGCNGISSPVFKGFVNHPLWVGGRPKGILAVHVHEHKPGHLSLATHPSGSLLASCSSGDGLVKFWDCGRRTSDFLKSNTTNDFDSRSGTSDYAHQHTNCTGHSGFVGQCLPSKSSTTYSVGKADRETSSATCRHLVWIDSGSSVATIANRSSIHLIDCSLHCLRGLFSLPVSTNGMATYLAAPSVTTYPVSLPSSHVAAGTDHNLLVYSTTNGNIIGQDIRSPHLVWTLKQDRTHGLIRCLAVHSGHTWLVSGTSRGHIVNWDLRYQQELSFSYLPYNGLVSILNLQIFDNRARSSFGTPEDSLQPSILIVAATDHHNEIAIFDLEAATPRFPSSTRIASTWAQPGCDKPITFTKSSPVNSVHAMLCLPPAYDFPSKTFLSPDERNAVTLPNIISGGHDARIRYWEMSNPINSCVLTWSGNEETFPPHVSHREIIINGVRITVEDIQSPVTRKPGPTSLLTTSRNVSTTAFPGHLRHDLVSNIPAFPASGPLEITDATRGHNNTISDLAIINENQPFLVSASMNGTIKFWK